MREERALRRWPNWARWCRADDAVVTQLPQKPNIFPFFVFLERCIPGDASVELQMRQARAISNRVYCFRCRGA